MLQYSLLTLNIQTLDALERNHLFTNTLVDRAWPINAAPTQHVERDNSSKVLGGPSTDHIWFIKTEDRELLVVHLCFSTTGWPLET